MFYCGLFIQALLFPFLFYLFKFHLIQTFPSTFLSAFQAVKESLDGIHNNVKGMSDSCKSMQVIFIINLNIENGC